MNTPPTDKECEIILQWMHTYYDGVLNDYERYFIQDNYYKDEFTELERDTVREIVARYLDPMPESLEKLLAPVSDCCRAPMNVVGRVTMFYECTLCGKPCDPIKIPA